MGLVKISELPDADTLTGEELYPLNQNGNTKKGSAASGQVAAPTGVAIIDTAIINAATAAANTAAIAAGTSQVVHLQAGTYVVTPNTDDQGPYCIQVYPNIVIRGRGMKATKVKLANSVGDYMSIFRGLNIGTDVSGFALEDLTVDQNDTNNVITNTTLNGGVPQAFFPLSGPITPRNAVRAATSNNVAIRRCRFTDAGGINILSFHTSGTNLTIQDCVFDDIGTSPVYYDHSTIYTFCDGQTITGNVFQGVAGGLAAICAIETHGPNQVVTGNRIDNYLYGMNITGMNLVEDDNVVVTCNTIDNCCVGINIWSMQYQTHTTGYGLLNAAFSQNTITINRDLWAVPFVAAGAGANVVPSGITLASASSLPFKTLDISYNTIRNLTTAAAAITGEEGHKGAGITLYAPLAGTSENITVSNNTIIEPLSAGVLVWMAAKRLYVKHNKIVNPGVSTATYALRFKSGIVLYSESIAGSVTDAEIHDNDIVDDRGTHRILHAGVTFYSDSASKFINVSALNNRMRIADGAAIPLYEFPSQTTNAIYVMGVMPAFVAPAGQAKAGSTLLDTVTGLTWKQTAAPQGSTWQSLADIISVVGGFTVDATNTDTTGVGAQAIRAKSPSTAGVRVEIESTSTNGRKVAWGNNFVSGNGETALYDYTSGGTRILVSSAGEVSIPGAFKPTGNLGFYGTTPIAKQTGVAVDAASIHAALVALGLIGA